MRVLQRSFLMVPALAVLLVPSARAQRRRPPNRGGRNGDGGEAGWYFGGAAAGAFGRGSDRLGGSLFAGLPVGLGGALRLRADVSALFSTERTRRYDVLCSAGGDPCFAGGPDGAQGTTFFAGVGPELAARLPGGVAPYVALSAGIGSGGGSSAPRLDGPPGDPIDPVGDPFFADQGPSGRYRPRDGFGGRGDVGLAARAGGGVRVRVLPGRYPLSLDLGAAYQWNDLAQGRRFRGNGSDAAVLQLGVTVSTGRDGGGGRDDRRPPRRRRRRRD